MATGKLHIRCTKLMEDRLRRIQINNSKPSSIETTR